MRRAIDSFHRERQSSARFGRTAVTGHHETVEICVTRTGQNVVILGDGPLADELRACFPVQGWQIASLPVPGTALRDVAGQLDSRVYNAVARSGYRTLEEVAAVCDGALLDIRGFGSKSVDNLRGVVAAQLAKPGTALIDDRPVTFTGPQVRELASLLGNLIDITTARGSDAIARRASDMLAALRPGTDTSPGSEAG
ncbi:DNA-directed RNA polymerase subunit alpha C-terminal domain-containing protein [Longispora albida]|uniref:DNA-directed RNA polymerase subunit alpha C-terminal domain-containing protein n=1 Tax=Longispora albida TaxID=203523 RepID=UPI00037E0F4F|nr:DNA-directed RNA polymerase subunit alpha C-terminal domain-containing protein [Longispora albida]